MKKMNGTITITLVCEATMSKEVYAERLALAQSQL